MTDRWAAGDLSWMTERRRMLADRVFDRVARSLAISTAAREGDEGGAVLEAHQRAVEAIADAGAAGVPHLVIEMASTAALSAVLRERSE